jgi:hypothetical protein
MIFGSVTSIVIGRQVESKAAHERHMRDREIEIYQDLIDHVLDLETGRAQEERNEVKSARAMTRSLTTWGPDDALKKWITYIGSVRGDHSHSSDNLDQLQADILEGFLDPKADTLLAIRKELGHKNKGISEDDVLTIVVPYIKDLRTRSKKLI